MRVVHRVVFPASVMKSHTRRQRFQQHVQRLRELAHQDASRRCQFCKQALPPTGVHVLVAASGDHRFCSSECLESFEQVQALGSR